MKYKGKLKGFAQRTHFDGPTPSLPSVHCPNDITPVTVSQELIKADLLEFHNEALEPDSPFYRFAVRNARDAFHLKSKVKMLHLKEVFDQDLELWNHSPGLPWNDLGYKTTDDVRRDHYAVQRIRKFWHLVKHGEQVSPPDCCAYVCAHVVERPEVKVRAVWGYPATITFGEAVFALPLIRAYQKGGTPIAYHYETGNAGFAKLRATIEGKWYCSFDFSKFDKTVPAWLIKKAFYILADNIDFLYYQTYGVADVSRTWLMYNYIMDYFINTTIKLANGDRWEKDSGIPSGSYFTQLIRSICNYILIKWFCCETRVSNPKILVFGDNSLISSTDRVDVDKFSKLAGKVGMKINIQNSGSI